MFEKALYTISVPGGSRLPIEQGVYVCGYLEERSRTFLSEQYPHVELIKLEEHDQTSFSINDGQRQPISSHSFYAFYNTLQNRVIYLDITGLSHSIWAPLLKVLIEAKANFRIIYVEPDKYRKKYPAGDEDTIYDLGGRITSIRPIPGFATLTSEVNDFLFVPLLGFEGARFLHMVDTVDPSGRYSFPIIGVPGFKISFPFDAHFENRVALRNGPAWRNVRYVPAHCLFSIFLELENLMSQHQGFPLKVALVGTKPHAVGAVLMRLMYPERVELIYDHPIRLPERTEGIAKKHMFDVMAFLNSSQTHRATTSQERLR